MRYFPLYFVVLSLCILSYFHFSGKDEINITILVAVFALSLLGIKDLLQNKHAVLRNYPLIGRFRYLLEYIRPEIRQYFLENDQEEVPFSRDQRAMVYRRAKNIKATKSFGTLKDVYRPGHECILHSMTPTELNPDLLRVNVGSKHCTKPYSASILNISAMSFGALSANAIRALSRGAQAGHFYLCTGEGGISRYHKEVDNDLVFQVGTGYFGCRNDQGQFDEAVFSENALLDQVKMIEVKISQGAKPAHGGILPASKVTKEIAAARGVEPYKDCISPPTHSAFSGSEGLIQFIARLRYLSGGKPVGIKLCVGRPDEIHALIKTFKSAGNYPDYIVIDGAEGGTGAAPQEFSDHIGMPLRDALALVKKALIEAGLRDEIRIACSGKAISGFDIIRLLASGADWVNSARGFMFSLGCIQAQSCGGDCPTGIATQDPSRQRGLVVDVKAVQVESFHRHTLRSVSEILGAAGIASLEEVDESIIHRRDVQGKLITLKELS